MRVDPARMAVGAAINDIQDTGPRLRNIGTGARGTVRWLISAGVPATMAPAARRLGRERRALFGPHAEATAGAAIDVASEEGAIPAEGHMRIQHLAE
jgi:hypothetical protein